MPQLIELPERPGRSLIHTIITSTILFSLLLFAGLQTAAQRNVFQLSSPPTNNTVDYPLSFIYELLTDSVGSIVYESAPISPYTSWLQVPAYIVRRDQIDSLKSTMAFKPGYYIAVSVYRNTISRTVIHKSALHINILDIERIKVLTITDDSNRQIKDAAVTLGSKRIAYEEGMQGYVIRDFSKDSITVRRGKELQYFRCQMIDNDYYQPPHKRNEAEEEHKQNRLYTGYLVTNKPMYLPHDTVKWKAYLQNPFDKNRPVRENLKVYFEDQYGGGPTYMISLKHHQEEPGVFFGEFVLGDSVQIDRLYTLHLYGTRSACRINQSFKVADYLLNETKLRITGENNKFYQPGDSVNLYAFAFTSNNLPVLDGQLRLTATQYRITGESTKEVFIPDTLYSALVPVSPDGETNIGFSTKGFPAPLTNIKYTIALANSNYETRDTTIFINYSSESRYLYVIQTGKKIHAELISNKKSVPGKGLFSIAHHNYSQQARSITYPYDYTIEENDVSLDFKLIDDTGKVLAAYTHPVEEAGITGIEDFSGDTAILRLYNPSGVRFRYSIFRGNDFEGYGSANGDTTIRLYSKKGKTVTIIGAYNWRGEARSRRFDLYKLDRDLNITLTKKDFVYPGQRDTIHVHLATKDGRNVDRTNVTVLAFNSQFTEDYTPELPYSGLLYPAYNPRKNYSVVPVMERGLYNVVADSIWLSRCGADTAFFYKNLYLLPDGIAWVNYEIPGSIMPQLGIYLQRAHTFYQPEMVYVDGKLAYIGQLNTTNTNGLFIKEGRHDLRFRMADTLYSLNGIELCAGIKTDLYLNLDQVGSHYRTDTVGRKVTTYLLTNHLTPITHKWAAPDSLTSTEKDEVANCTFMYRSEPVNYHYFNYNGVSYSAPQLIQYPLALSGVKNALQRQRGYGYRDYYGDPNLYLMGPISFADSALFFQHNNTKLQFLPERGYIFTFRPQMTRVATEQVYTYLNYKLTNAQTWPVSQFVSPNPPLFDTMRLSEQELPVSRVKYAIAQGQRIQYSLTVSNYSAYADRNATAGMVLSLPVDSNIRYMILHRPGDTAAIISTNKQVRIPRGKYELYVIWRNNHASIYAPVLLQANGATIVPISSSNELSTFALSKPYTWLNKSVVRDTMKESGYVFYSTAPSASSAGIAGTFHADQDEPAANVLVQVFTKGILMDSMHTDKQGHFRTKALPAGDYNLVIRIQSFCQHINQVPVMDRQITTFNDRLFYAKTLAGVVVTVKPYRKPLIDFKSPAHGIRVAEELEHAPTTSQVDMASLSTQSYQQRNGYELSLGGGRSSGEIVIVDGVMLASGNSSFSSEAHRFKDSPSEEPALAEDKEYYLTSKKSQTFLNNFIANMMSAAGMRKSFRDWAIWEPNLWTGKDGTATFDVTYPDNITSWKTYVLAMNRKRYSGKIMQLTRAFKPLSAQLSIPRFIRYGDTVEVLGKVANYTRQPYTLRSSFKQDSVTTFNDTMTVHNTKVDLHQVAAPVANVIDTGMLTLAYSINTANGYNDGEEKTIPLYPVGVTESKGIFVLLKGDTSLVSAPDTTAGYFTGNARVCVDGSLLETMLREIEQLKVYPHGCNEQLTTMLLSIYYEEAIKQMLGHTDFNNTKAKRKILEKLVQAQRADGSYGWWSNNDADYRITNYIISTMQKINKDGWLDFIIRRGLNNLSYNLEAMSTDNQIASMTTLSGGHYAANYKPVLDKIDKNKQNLYNRLAMVKIRKEQGLPYRAELDTLMGMRKETMQGIYWGATYSYFYDWYRDDLATTLLAYGLVKGDSIYNHLAEPTLRYILFRRQHGYYGNTASSGLVLTTILPDLLNQKMASTSKTTYLKISGSIRDSIHSFPKVYSLKQAQPQFFFEKKGISPVYVSVVYDYFNNHPKPKDDDFSVHTYFLNSLQDTVLQLKAGEQITLRTTIHCKKETDYAMIEVPIPAGCVQVDKGYSYRFGEAARENFKDQTDIFCNKLNANYTYTFDVVLEARYKGRFNISPARAGMMYYPEEYGNTEAKAVRIK